MKNPSLPNYMRLPHFNQDSLDEAYIPLNKTPLKRKLTSSPGKCTSRKTSKSIAPQTTKGSSSKKSKALPKKDVGPIDKYVIKDKRDHASGKEAIPGCSKGSLYKKDKVKKDCRSEEPIPGSSKGPRSVFINSIKKDIAVPEGQHNPLMLDALPEEKRSEEDYGSILSIYFEDFPCVKNVPSL